VKSQPLAPDRSARALLEGVCRSARDWQAPFFASHENFGFAKKKRVFRPPQREIAAKFCGSR
jgi:hypothetical protein